MTASFTFSQQTFLCELQYHLENLTSLVIEKLLFSFEQDHTFFAIG